MALALCKTESRLLSRELKSMSISRQSIEPRSKFAKLWQFNIRTCGPRKCHPIDCSHGSFLTAGTCHPAWVSAVVELEEVRAVGLADFVFSSTA